MGRGVGMTQPAWMTTTASVSAAGATGEAGDRQDEDKEVDLDVLPSSGLSSTVVTSATAAVTTSDASDQGVTPVASVLSEASKSQTQQHLIQVHQSTDGDRAVSPQQQLQQSYPHLPYQQQYQYQYQRQDAAASGATSSHLDRLLDAIDSTKTNSNTGTNGGIGGGEEAAVLESPYDWSKHQDPATRRFYFYNYKTGVTQWYAGNML